MSLNIISIEQHPACRERAMRLTPPAFPDAIYSTRKGYVPVIFGGFTIAGYCLSMAAAFTTIHEIRAERAKEVRQ